MIELRCLSCNHVEGLLEPEVIQRLRQSGKLRREAKPDHALVIQLASASAPGWNCAACDQIGLTASEREFEGDDGWGGAVACKRCKSAIPPARIEIFPDATLCADCQSKEDAGETSDEPDFCPRCGSIMELKKSHRGVTRFELACMGCRR